MNEDVSFKDIKLSHGVQPLEGVGYDLHEPTTAGTANPKVFFGNKIDARLHKALKVYAVNNNLEISYVLEAALSEYFVNHRSDFPATNLTIAVEQQPRPRKQEKAKTSKCMFANCENTDANDKATRIYDSKILTVCSDHLAYCQEHPNRFKVL